MAIINSSRFINSVMLPLSSCGTNPFAFRVIRKKVCWRMTANRLPNHVTPTKRYFRLCPLLAPSQASGTKVCTFGTLCKSLAKNFQIFCTFILKMANCSKGLCFAIGKTLFWRMILFKRYKKAPDYPRPKKYNVGGGYFFSSSLSPAT